MYKVKVINLKVGDLFREWYYGTGEVAKEIEIVTKYKSKIVYLNGAIECSNLDGSDPGYIEHADWVYKLNKDEASLARLNS
jgi:hypothetical protein